MLNRYIDYDDRELSIALGALAHDADEDTKHLIVMAARRLRAQAAERPPLCRCGHAEHVHLWPACWGCNRRLADGESFGCDADEDCDCDGFVPDDA